MVLETHEPKLKGYTVEEFERFVDLPENADKLFEYIGEEIIEVPSNPYSSQIASIISGFIFMFLRQNASGHLTGEAGGFMVSGERYAPDVAYISKEKQPELARRGYNPQPPDLVFEVMSPTDYQGRTTVKVSNYLAAGTLVVLVFPEDKELTVHRSGQPVQKLGMDDSFEAPNILPGFSLAVKDIFAE